MPVLRIGVISDTHGLLRPQALAALVGCEVILHAGDVGAREVLDELEKVARVVAVRGNVDRELWARALPLSRTVAVGGVRVALVHDLGTLEHEAAAAVDVVVYGHTHRPVQERREGVLYLNPGSAGPRRFHYPVTVGFLFVDEHGVRAEIDEIEAK